MRHPPFFIRMTGKQIQEIYAEEAKEHDLLAQICDETAEKTPELEEQDISGALDYQSITRLPSFRRTEAIGHREAARDLRRFSKFIDAEAVFDLGREDLFALQLVPSSFRSFNSVHPESLGKLQERRRQEH